MIPKNFLSPLKDVDPEISRLIDRELDRQEHGLEMIPSENFAPLSVLEANGSVLTNKYAEGLPGRRYYGGCEVVDEIEDIARNRAKQLFNVEFANVQPHSGAAANQVVFEAFLNPGDTILGMKLDHGGHLTHGSPVNFSGKRYNVIGYGVRQTDHLIDPDEVLDLARKHKPKLIIAGASAYPRKIDFSVFRKAADEVGAIFLSDVAHYAGLIAGGVYPSPSAHSDLVSTTTHKSLRGPRSGVIMGKEKFAKDINKTVFPGLQGGPHEHTIAAKAVCFHLAMQPEFKAYAQNVVDNARALAAALIKKGFSIVSGGTDSHLVLIDLRSSGLTGKEAQPLFDSVHITGNKNTIPYDPQPPLVCSGFRIGTPALTTRGMGAAEMEIVAELMGETVASRGDEAKLKSIRDRVTDLSKKFPLYGHRLVKE